jgi:hypothetical protein
MTRLVLLIILALLTWYYFPETRAMLFKVAEPVVLPIMKWDTEEEMAQVGRNVVDQERLTGVMPTGAAWLPWLLSRYATPEARTDPWGTLYQLKVWKDSVWIISAGPDRVRSTADDFHVTTPRG